MDSVASFRKAESSKTNRYDRLTLDLEAAGLPHPIISLVYLSHKFLVKCQKSSGKVPSAGVFVDCNLCKVSLLYCCNEDCFARI